MNHIAINALAIALLLSAVSCKKETAPEPQSGGAPAQGGAPKRHANATKLVPTTGVREIALPAFESELPPGKGGLTVMRACTLCHSSRYVLMQPNFPRKTWVAEVDKMKKVYGAVVLDDQLESIVNYLVSIRGNGQ